MVELKVDRDKAIELMKEIVKLWDGLPWYIMECRIRDGDYPDEFVELYEIPNMKDIENKFIELFGRNYQGDI